MNSRFFTVEEFRCHSGEEYPAVWVVDRLAALCRVLDAIRETWGSPLYVVSGYRSSAFNEALARASAARNGGVSGVAQSSQHIQGRAADIRPARPYRAAVASLHEVVREMYDSGRLPGLGGLGEYPGWIHVDVRATTPGHLATWRGAGMGESS